MPPPPPPSAQKRAPTRRATAKQTRETAAASAPLNKQTKKHAMHSAAVATKQQPVPSVVHANPQSRQRLHPPADYVAKTCKAHATRIEGCRYGAKCRRAPHDLGEIIAEHALIACANGDQCAAIHRFGRDAPLYTDPAFGATCTVCNAEHRRAEFVTSTPCKYFGRSVVGCRKGEECEHEHNYFSSMDFYGLHRCPNGENCVNSEQPNLCPGQQCTGCHERMVKERETAQAQAHVQQEERQQHRAKVREARQKEALEPCSSRKGCANYTPGGRTCRTCVELADEYAPPWATQQRFGRMR